MVNVSIRFKCGGEANSIIYCRDMDLSRQTEGGTCTPKIHLIPGYNTVTPSTLHCMAVRSKLHLCETNSLYRFNFPDPNFIALFVYMGCISKHHMKKRITTCGHQPTLQK